MRSGQFSSQTSEPSESSQTLWVSTCAPMHPQTVRLLHRSSHVTLRLRRYDLTYEAYCTLLTHSNHQLTRHSNPSFTRRFPGRHPQRRAAGDGASHRQPWVQCDVDGPHPSERALVAQRGGGRLGPQRRQLGQARDGHGERGLHFVFHRKQQKLAPSSACHRTRTGIILLRLRMAGPAGWCDLRALLHRDCARSLGLPAARQLLLPAVL